MIKASELEERWGSCACSSDAEFEALVGQEQAALQEELLGCLDLQKHIRQGEKGPTSLTRSDFPENRDQIIHCYRLAG